jgi:hypothetical protein
MTNKFQNRNFKKTQTSARFEFLVIGILYLFEFCNLSFVIFSFLKIHNKNYLS